MAAIAKTTSRSSSYNDDEHNRDSKTHSFLPKEPEQAERKRPLAIQELLEKKRARLAHGTTSTMGMMDIGDGDGEKNEETMKPDDRTDTELSKLVGHLCSGREQDGETTSSASSTHDHDDGANCCTTAEPSFEQLLRKAMMTNPQRILNDPQLLLALRPEINLFKKSGEQRKCITKSSSSSPSKTSSGIVEIAESPLSKSVPHNRIFAQVPGRLSLLSNVVKYKMTVGEVRRRLMGPESFNFSLLGALLRRAKMPEKSQMLVDELSQVGLSIPRGRRTGLSKVILLSALTEAESIQFAKDFKKIAELEFPARQMALELVPLQQKSRNVDKADKNSLPTLLDKLRIALNFTTQFLELLENDQSPVMDMESYEKPVHLSADLQGSLSNFSQLTHGFGNPAIQVGVDCFRRFLAHQIEMTEERMGNK